MTVTELAMKKATKSPCAYKVSAVGFDKKGDLVGTCTNTHRFVWKGGGLHAEMRLMARYGKNLKTIVICRVGRSGELRPIDPCNCCREKADELGIKIVTVNEIKD